MFKVHLDEEKTNHLLKSNPLMKQEVGHAFYKNEQKTLKPLAKYAYDNFGSMVNQHRQKKNSTVGKYI